MFNQIRIAMAEVASHSAGAIEEALGGTFLGEFITSESGRVNPEQGFRFAWAAGVIVAAAVVLGTPPKAAASCSGGFSGCHSQAHCIMYCQVWEGCSWGVCYTDRQWPHPCDCS